MIQLTAALDIVQTSREEALLQLLLNAMKQLSTRDLVEEFCAFRVWPLAEGWHVELGAPKFGLLTITVKGCEGMILGPLLFCFLLLIKAAYSLVVAPIAKVA